MGIKKRHVSVYPYRRYPKSGMNEQELRREATGLQKGVNVKRDDRIR